MNTWQNELVGSLMVILVSVLSALVPLLVRAATKYLEKKLSIEISREQEAALEQAIWQSVSYAEEQVRKHTKAGTPQWTGDRKMSVAVSFVFAELVRRGVRKAGQPITDAEFEQVAARIEATLEAHGHRGPKPAPTIVTNIDPAFAKQVIEAEIDRGSAPTNP